MLGTITIKLHPAANAIGFALEYIMLILWLQLHEERCEIALYFLMELQACY